MIVHRLASLIRGRALLALIIVTGAFTILATSLAVEALRTQQRSIDVTCSQVKELRADIVALLEAARDLSLMEGRPAHYTEAQEADRQQRIRDFYRPQLAELRPVTCP